MDTPNETQNPTPEVVPPVQPMYTPAPVVAESIDLKNDAPDTVDKLILILGGLFLSFLIPFISWFVWRKSEPAKSQYAFKVMLIILVVDIIIGCIIGVVFGTLIAGLSSAVNSF